MKGYLAHHYSKLWDGVRADVYRNDPYVWATPYLWSFCHTGQRPKVEPGMTVLWISKDDENRFVCDLVFVVAEILPFAEGLAGFRQTDDGVALDHFLPGIEYHFNYIRKSYAKTYVADMEHSYIPHPAVEVEQEIDQVRLSEWPESKPLGKAWGRQTTPLVIEKLERLEEVVATRAEKRLRGPLPHGNWVPGKGPALR